MFCIEMLTFEVVDFPGTYHAILDRPCYAKFISIPINMYLKLKIPGPKGIITVEGDGSLHQAHLYE